MRNSSKRAFSILIASILFIASLVTYSSFISPAYEDIQQKRGEVASAQKKLDDYKKLMEKVNQALSQYQSEEQARQAISLAFPTNPEIPKAAYQIIGSAEEGKVSVNMISGKESLIVPSKSDLIKGRGVVSFDAQVTGSYQTFKNFVLALEQNIRILDIESISMNRIKPDASAKGVSSIQDSFRYSVRINTYFQSK